MKYLLLVLALCFVQSTLCFSQTAEAYYNRRIEKSNLGNTSDACADWKKALELGITQTEDFIKKYCR